MPTRPYNAKLLQRARELRINATKQERKLWYEFLREFRPRFTRQRIVGNYILDFYCGKAKLAIELDGSQHYESESVKYDKIRTKYLEELGIKVVRFANTDIINSFEGVCGEIIKEVESIIMEQPPPSADGTPFTHEGGKDM